MKNLKVDPSIQKIEKILNQKDFLIIIGYIGTTNEKLKTRIYFDKTTLDSFIELDSDKIFDFQQEKKDDEYLTKFIIDADSKVLFCKISRLKMLFEGEGKCSCQEEQHDKVAKIRNPQNLALACRMNCGLSKEKCMQDLMGRGVSEGLASLQCTRIEDTCNSVCNDPSRY